jgi:hypothetical protein
LGLRQQETLLQCTLRSSNASTLAAFFWEEIFCQYKVVKKVAMDNGPEIEGAFRELLEKY